MQTQAYNLLALINHGQVCFSTERVLVERSIAEKFIALLKDKACEWPQDHAVNARIIKASYDKLADAKAKGATFILGDAEYFSETALKTVILTDVTKQMEMWDEETFGPSTTIRIVKNEEEAIEVVNESQYGLDAQIFCRDMKKALDIAGRLEVGRVRVNSSGHERKSLLTIMSVQMLTRWYSYISISSSQSQWVWSKQCWPRH